jgi:hypothetical protein
MDAQSLSLHRPAPDGMENAANKYREAFALIAKGDTSVLDWTARYWLSFTKAPIPPPTLSSDFDRAASLLREASQLPTIDWGIAPASRTVQTTFPHLSQLREAALLLNVHAVREAETGRIDSAIRDIHAIRAMARNSQPPQTLAEGLVSVGFESYSYVTVEAYFPLSTMMHRSIGWSATLGIGARK